MNIYVYAGYYVLYVSPKQLAKPFLLQGVLESVEDAEIFLDANFDTENDTVYYERSIFSESRISFLDDVEDEAEKYKFDVDDNGNIIN